MSDFPYLKIKHYINGAWKEEAGTKTEPLYNPSTGELIGEVPMASPELAKEAIATAHEAYKPLPTIRQNIFQKLAVKCSVLLKF